jgi:dTDP-4-dehydrorhamnose 3,5-epimerase-like enzyme
MDLVKIEVLRMPADARGYVFEPLGPEALGGFRNVHVVYSAPGAVRGSHYHLKGMEVCSVTGPTLVRYRLKAKVHDVLVPAGQAWRFTFPPGVAHAFRNEGNEPTLLAAFNTEEHSPDQPDLVREILIA